MSVSKKHSRQYVDYIPMIHIVYLTESVEAAAKSRQALSVYGGKMHMMTAGYGTKTPKSTKHVVLIKEQKKEGKQMREHIMWN